VEEIACNEKINIETFNT